MSHAFFADMGGIHLRCLDLPAFPINTVHFLWLLENGHIEYPALAETTIRDKNKADTLARSISVLQVAWFTVQLIARGIEGLSITTLELSTSGFVFCTLNTFWFWKHKPLDVTEPITIICEKDLESIVQTAAAANGVQWRTARSPLSFLDVEAEVSHVSSFFYLMRTVFNRHSTKSSGYITSFANSDVTHPGFKAMDTVYAYVFGMIYFGIHFAAWDFHFASLTEVWLWRSSCIVLASICAGYEFTCWPGNRVAKCFLSGNIRTANDILRAMPQPLMLTLLFPWIVIYLLARSYIIVEGFVGLRALPESAFRTVQWSSFVPHF